MEAILLDSSRVYNPARDLANLWPHLLEGLAHDLIRLTPASPAGRLAGDLGVTPDDTLPVVSAMAAAFGAVARNEAAGLSAKQLIEAAGVTAFPAQVLAVVLARLGERVTAVALESYRDALMDETRWQASTVPALIAAALAADRRD